MGYFNALSIHFPMQDFCFSIDRYIASVQDPVKATQSGRETLSDPGVASARQVAVSTAASSSRSTGRTSRRMDIAH